MVDLRRRKLLIPVAAVALWPLATRAQQTKVARIGAIYLGIADGESDTGITPFGGRCTKSHSTELDERSEAESRLAAAAFDARPTPCRRPYTKQTISPAAFDTIQHFTNGFYSANEKLFLERVEQHRIRDCHGFGGLIRTLMSGVFHMEISLAGLMMKSCGSRDTSFSKPTGPVSGILMMGRQLIFSSLETRSERG